MVTDGGEEVMEPVVVVGGARVFLGDCREVLKSLPDNSVDSVVTDPPYELGFMGKSWDSSGIAYDVTVWEECLRVLKPGGHVLAFGGSRTFHRLAVAVEDAGFEIRDNIAWISSKTFPKSLDVSKAIDKKLGAEREITAWVKQPFKQDNGAAEAEYNQYKGTKTSDEAGYRRSPITEAVTAEAQRWDGWGTGLKQVVEPVVLARKPFGKGVTVAGNVLAWGVGGLNIDGSRIGSDARETSGMKSLGVMHDDEWKPKDLPSKTVHGRWPANVILDEVTAGLLDEQSGVLKPATSRTPAKPEAIAKAIFGGGAAGPLYNDTGGASRFFYVAKTSKRDRNEGLEDSNGHPTVKPTQLMRYLIKLVTPPGGTVLDPFTGSGSTGKAALLDGFNFVGAELTEEYLPIIEGRLRWAMEQEGETDERLF